VSDLLFAVEEAQQVKGVSDNGEDDRHGGEESLQLIGLGPAPPAVKIKYAGVDDEVITVDVQRIPLVEALRHFNAYLILVSLSSCRLSLIDSGFPRGAGNS
jgi:hypothetical protein